MMVVGSMAATRPMARDFANVYGTIHTMFSLDQLVRRAAFIALAGFLSSCSTFDLGNKVWYKPGGTVEERDRLLAAAQVQAEQMKAAYDPNNTGVKPNVRETERHTVLTFMTAAGWSLVPPAEAKSLDHAQVTSNKDPHSHTAPLPVDG